MTLSLVRSFTLNRPGQRPDEGARLRSGVASASAFAGLSVAAVEAVAAAVTLRRTAESGFVYRRGEAAEHLVWVLSGEVKESVCGGNGREVTLRALGAGAVLGDGSVIAAGLRATDAIATASAETLWLARTELERFVREQPQIALNLLALAAARVRHAEETISQFALLDVPERLAVHLADLALANGVSEPSGRMLRMRPTQQELANRVGSCRETVSRAMNQMVRDGLLIAHGRALLVTHAMLARVALARAA